MLSTKISVYIMALVLPGVCSLFTNTTEVIVLYARYCGHHRLCKPEVVGFPIPVTYTQNFFNQCPGCYCDKDCFTYGDCCIDLLLEPSIVTGTSTRPEDKHVSPNDRTLDVLNKTPSSTSTQSTTEESKTEKDMQTTTVEPEIYTGRHTQSKTVEPDINTGRHTQSSTIQPDSNTDRNMQSMSIVELSSEMDARLPDKYECLAGYVVVSTCSADYRENFDNMNRDTDVKQKCEQKDEFTNDPVSQIPVFSNVSAVSYNNVYCARCNNDTNGIKAWIANLPCKFTKNFGEYETINDIFSNSKKECGFEIYVQPPEHQGSFRRCNRYKQFEPNIKTCSVLGKKTLKPFVDVACQVFNIPFLHEGVVFKNVFCYHCNIFVLESAQFSEVSPDSVIASSTMTSLERSRSTTTWMSSQSQLIDTCPVVHNPSLAYERLVWPCENLIQFRRNPDGVSFKNIFCCKCSFITNKKCTVTDFDNDFKLEKKSIISSYKYLFDFTSMIKEFTSEKDETDRPCPVVQFLDPYLGSCRDIVCSPGRRFMYKEDACLPVVDSGLIIGYSFNNTYLLRGNTSYILKDWREIADKTSEFLFDFGVKTFRLITVYTSINDTTASTAFLQEMMSHFQQVFLEDLSGPIAFIHIEMTFYLESVSVSSRNYAEELLMTLQRQTLFLTHDGRDVMLTPTNSEYSAIINVLESKVRPENETFLSEDDGVETCFNKFTIFKKTKDMFYFKHMTFINIHQLLICKQVLLDQNEYVLINESFIKVKANEREYGPLKYILLANGMARLCLRDYTNGDAVKKMLKMSVFEHVLDIIGWILTVMSLASLCLTFLTYCIHDTMRTHPGKNNMFLVALLFLAQLFLSIGSYGKWEVSECIIFGMLIHYFWICAFLSMNVCSFHMFRVFSVPITQYIEDDRLIWYYVNYIFATPLFVLTATVVTNLITTEGVSLGYGHSICLLTGNRNVGVFFVLPVVSSITLNSVYFFITVCKIKTAVKNDRNAMDNSEYVMYLKLFSLTGVSWLLHILDSQFSFLYLRLFSVVINASQGLFIFWGYVCNKRVLGMYRKLLSNIKQSNLKNVSNVACDSSTPNRRLRVVKMRSTAL